MRILIIRPSSIGDVVMASPILKALKTGLDSPTQGVEIDWLIDPALVSLLEDNPYIDNLIKWDKAKWKGLMGTGDLAGLLKEILSFKRLLGRRDYDLALDIQGLFRSRLLAYLSGARERIGFESKEPGRFLMTRIVTKGPHDSMMGSEYLYLMDEMGIAVKDPAPKLFIPKKAKTRALTLLKDLRITGPYVAFSPFTTRPQKHWVFERWITLGSAILDRFALPIVVLGGPQDANPAAKIAQAAPDRIKAVAGRLKLIESAAVVAMATALIGVDTGLTHMGTALKTPTIALFGATCPYLKTPLKTTKVLYHALQCSPCRRSPTCSDFPCMKAITCNEVIETLGGLIGAG